MKPRAQQTRRSLVIRVNAWIEFVQTVLWIFAAVVRVIAGGFASLFGP